MGLYRWRFFNYPIYIASSKLWMKFIYMYIYYLCPSNLERFSNVFLFTGLNNLNTRPRLGDPKFLVWFFKGNTRLKFCPPKLIPLYFDAKNLLKCSILIFLSLIKLQLFSSESYSVVALSLWINDAHTLLIKRDTKARLLYI